MARILKKGLDYFPFDCHLDSRFKLLRIECGALSLGVIVMLYQRIFGGEGYYTDWNRDLAMLFSAESGVSLEEVDRIVEVAMRREIFDREMYDKYGILTSKDIQERFIEATSRRKHVELNEEYALIMYTSCQHNDDEGT